MDPDAPELILATIENNIDRVRELLLPGVTADVNIPDTYGLTALSHAAEQGRTEIARMLLDYQRGTPEAVDVNVLDDAGTPLHRAIYEGHDEIAKMLLREPNINVNIFDRNGEGPFLMLAKDEEGVYENGRGKEIGQEIAGLFFARNDLDVNVSDNDRFTPFDYAVIHNNIHLATLILNYPGFKGTHFMSNLANAQSKEMIDLILSHPLFNVNDRLPKPERILRRDKTYEYQSFYPPTLPKTSRFLQISFNEALSPEEESELRRRAIRHGAIYRLRDVIPLYKEDIQKLNAIAVRMQFIDKIIPHTMTSYDSQMPSRLNTEVEYDEESRSYKRSRSENLPSDIQKLKLERDALSITSQVLIQELFRNLRIPPPDFPNNGFYVKEILRYLREKYYDETYV